jgi:hypothetical protein
MTLLISWIGVDSRKISSLYIASDSRISWGTKAHYDSGRKVFASKNYPVVVGYCGDVAFPSLAISQVVEHIDLGLLFPRDSSNDQKFEIFYNKITEQFQKYPTKKEGILSDSIEILFACRNLDTDFFCKKMKWTKKSDIWEIGTIQFSPYSNKLFVVGSGKEAFEHRFIKFLRSNESRTSRSVFQCLCETLESKDDRYCGGAPQLVGLYNKGNSHQFGIIHEGKRYLNGLELNEVNSFNEIQWRNKLFEICDGNTKEIKLGSQKQPRF